MDFLPLETEGQLKEINDAKGFQIIFKHNTTCPISRSVRRSFEDEAKETLRDDTKVYFLDLLAHRSISNAIAEEYNVVHESPQLLAIKNGKCFYHESLYAISAEAVAEAIESV